MDRRKAIKNIGVGLSASILVPPWISACDPKDPKPIINYDGVVGIIGAGAAGLQVADFLKAQGITVKIFEASDNLGGRVRSIRQFQDSPLQTDFPVELGADRVIGTDSSFADLIKIVRAPTVDVLTGTNPAYFLDNAFTSFADALLDPDFVAAVNFYENISTYTGANVSVQNAVQAAGLSSRVYEILNAWIGNQNGTGNSRLSMLATAEAKALITHDSGILTLKSNPLQDSLSSRFSNVIEDIQYNTPITSVNYSGELIELIDQSATIYTVNKLVVAVPISILKADAITFAPGLPAEKTNALSRMRMDSSIRVVMDFKQNFWGEDITFLQGGTDCPEYFSSGIGRSAYNKTLSLTIAGEKAEQLSPLGANMVPVLLEELDSIFDGKATANVRRDDENNIISVIQDWTMEPFIKGGRSYAIPGGTNTDREDLALPINDLVFFAGEATDTTGQFGTVSGALLSGERAALEVIDAIVSA